MGITTKYIKTYHFPNGSFIDKFNRREYNFGDNGGYWQMDRRYVAECLVELRKMKHNKPNKICDNFPYVKPNTFQSWEEYLNAYNRKKE